MCACVCLTLTEGEDTVGAALSELFPTDVSSTVEESSNVEVPVTVYVSSTVLALSVVEVWVTVET